MASEHIRAWREGRGWSQQELATELGVDQATVSRIERGVTDPNGPVKKLLDRLMAEPVAPAEAAE